MQLVQFYKLLFKSKKKISITDPMKKFLIVGLGNIGEKYDYTRHNIGFEILDELASKEGTNFVTEKLGSIAKFRFKGRTFILLKPSTFMNLSGKSVKYWLTKENIPLENLLVICDDLKNNSLDVTEQVEFALYDNSETKAIERGSFHDEKYF